MPLVVVCCSWSQRMWCGVGMGDFFQRDGCAYKFQGFTGRERVARTGTPCPPGSRESSRVSYIWLSAPPSVARQGAPAPHPRTHARTFLQKVGVARTPLNLILDRVLGSKSHFERHRKWFFWGNPNGDPLFRGKVCHYPKKKLKKTPFKL